MSTRIHPTRDDAGGSLDRPGTSAHQRGLAGQMDAELFLAFNGRLKQALQRLSDAQLPASRRSRWQRRLLAITETGRDDLLTASSALDRYEGEFRRETAG